MAKDPAFLFYSQDFLVGTMFMTNEQVGKYIKLLCVQHQKGGISKKDMENICEGYDEAIYNKFILENDTYYNTRLKEETIKRSKYVSNRLKNFNKSKNKDMEIHMETHMETHTENENENENKDANYNNIINKLTKKILKRNATSEDFKAMKEMYEQTPDKIQNALKHTKGNKETQFDYFIVQATLLGGKK